MGSATPITFDALELALERAGALTEAAEAHGHLCGLICLLGVDAAAQWPAQILDGEQNALTADEGTMQILQRLAQDTFGELEAGDMSFVLALPPDDRPLAERADSLAHWCQGFMHGIGLATGGSPQSVPPLDSDVAREIFRDFGEITRAAFADEETENEAETAYAEIVEYVRVSVQFLFEELHRVRSSATAVH